MRRRGGTGEIVDLVDLKLKRIDHVVTHEFETRMLEQMRDVLLSAGKEIIDDRHLMAFGDEPIAKMGTKKAGAAGDENTHGKKRDF